MGAGPPTENSSHLQSIEYMSGTTLHITFHLHNAPLRKVGFLWHREVNAFLWSHSE